MPWYVATYILNFIWLNVTAYYLAKRPRRWLWWLYAILVICFVALPMLVSCKPKAKSVASGSAAIPTVDSARIRLQNQADASRSAADRAANASDSTVTNYDRDAQIYDSIRVNLP